MPRVSNTIKGILRAGAGILANAPITLVNVRSPKNQALSGSGGGCVPQQREHQQKGASS